VKVCALLAHAQINFCKDHDPFLLLFLFCLFFVYLQLQLMIRGSSNTQRREVEKADLSGWVELSLGFEMPLQK